MKQTQIDKLVKKLGGLNATKLSSFEPVHTTKKERNMLRELTKHSHVGSTYDKINLLGVSWLGYNKANKFLEGFRSKMYHP